MSSLRNSSFNRIFTDQTTVHGTIALTDNVKQDELEEEEGPTALDGQSLSKPSTSTRVAHQRLRENLARRRYAKYSRERYEDDDVPDTLALPSRTSTTVSSTTLQRADTSATVGDGKSKDGRLRRGQARVKGFLGIKKPRRAKDGDSEIDILWENQRGSFLLGRPYYSSNSLLNFDPSPWTNVFGKPSAVDITNAQLPDPNWEWAWKTWYVDMSIDVDENGWQYSFMFQTRFPWHGTHPWGYSFVRRRRWIRKRVRKDRHLANGKVEGGDAMKEAHRLNADYFTIHPTLNRSPSSSYPASTTGNTLTTSLPEEETESIDNLRTLIQRMKRATVDREKLNLVLHFMDEGGQDIHYLAEEMPHVMSLFMYQYTRRRLLASMLQKYDDAPPHDPVKDVDLEGTGDTSSGSPTPMDDRDEASIQRHRDIKQAIDAAEREIKNFEYWSDIRGVIQSGDTLNAADEGHGWDESWQGLDRSGPTTRPDALHDLSAGSGKDHQQTEGKKDKGKGRA